MVIETFFSVSDTEGTAFLSGKQKTRQSYVGIPRNKMCIIVITMDFSRYADKKNGSKAIEKLRSESARPSPDLWDRRGLAELPEMHGNF